MTEADKPSVEGLMALADAYAKSEYARGTAGRAPSDHEPERDALGLALCDVVERLASEAAPAAQPAQEPKHRPSQEWYANMIAATLDDDFTIGHRTAAAQPIYWRHRKTGGVYRLVGHAQLQTDSPLVDMANVTVYQGEDGKLWARASGECGSRFDRVDAPPAAAQPATPLREVPSDEQISRMWVAAMNLPEDMCRIGNFENSPVHIFARALLAASSDEAKKT